MSKVEIVGEKTLLHNVLYLLRELGVFQIEPDTVSFIEQRRDEDIRPFLPREETALERIFLEGLRLRIDELITYLPKVAVRKSYFDPRSIIDTVAKTVLRHTARAKALLEKRDDLQKERSELGRYKIFLASLTSLLEHVTEVPDLDFIGLTIKEPEMVGHLRDAISRITNWKYELLTDTAQDGTLVGLITVEKDLSEKVKKSLSDEHVPELTFPATFSGLTFPERVSYVTERISEVSQGIERITSEMEVFSRRWLPIYLSAKDWIDDRLSLLGTSASAFETRMCFFIHGWMASESVEKMRTRLTDAFGTKIVIEEKEMREEDLERVPIILNNPSYFKPFELFTRLLPLPVYTSYDPTPFIGIFFPIFFGMILGDAGYGLLLFLASFVLMRRFRQKGTVRDGTKILMISSLYSIFFGILYGEFFGDLPHRLFGLEPIFLERRTAVIPMLYFALTIGVCHILLGLFLGSITAFKRKTKKEAAFKLLSIVLILCFIIILMSYFGLLPVLSSRPIVIAILLLIPFLLFTGGLLAPLEFLKSIGNIISYVRITAIGLTSVLLAFVANRLAGSMGNIVVGVFVAGLLHLMNIVLGMFSPTIHSMRLHYVEFFSKFIEYGGRKFEPL
ncbi:MAG TPA: ATPase, partial [Nitrospiraceae bacterium]|nr:ATPase [Nitrospiraceae bacterium]